MKGVVHYIELDLEHWERDFWAWEWPIMLEWFGVWS